MNNHKVGWRILVFLGIVFIMTGHFVSIPKFQFPEDSEFCFTGMLAAGILNLDTKDLHGFGMNRISCDGVVYKDKNITTAYDEPEGNSSLYFAFNCLEFADHDVQIIPFRKQQLGLQGWFMYYLGRSYSILHLPPKAYYYFARGFCAFLFALVITIVCYELHKAYNELMALCFYCACFCSVWIIDFASNLYFVPFTWFLPMMFGLMAMNNPDRMIYLCPLVFISVALKALCGYEHITCVMMCSVVFSASEFLSCLKTNRLRSMLMFKVSLYIGFSALAGFLGGLALHAYVRSGGSILEGLEEIYRADVVRSTFGRKGNYFVNMLVVIAKMFLGRPVGWAALGLLIMSYMSSRDALRRGFDVKGDVILSGLSFISSISWLVLAVGHSVQGVIINYPIWYMPFIPAALYVFLKQRILVLVPEQEKRDIFLNSPLELLRRILWLS